MNEEDLKRVLEKMPELTIHGYGTAKEGARLTYVLKADAPEQHKKSQDELFGRLEIMQHAADWLAHFPKVKTFDKERTSYSLKHRFSSEMREELGRGSYIENGAFIAAAIHADFECKAYPPSPNVCFNIGKVRR
jgi:hypothetical protein